jgi:hypothetical protein
MAVEVALPHALAGSHLRVGVRAQTKSEFPCNNRPQRKTASHTMSNEHLSPSADMIGDCSKALHTNRP